MPWLGYFEMGHRADAFVMFDDVQYIRREWVNRNKILSSNQDGWQWLIVPVKKCGQKTLINQVEVHNAEPWGQKMLDTIHHVYAKAEFYEKYVGDIGRLLTKKWDRLLDLNLASIRMFYSFLGMRDNIVLSSELNVPLSKDDKLAGICEKLGAEVYLANNGSADYIVPGKFHDKGIGFVFQDYTHPEYLTGRYRFVPYLSCMDVIFWHGPEALKIILNGRKHDWEKQVTYSKQ